MDPFFAPITLLSLVLIGSLVVHLLVWRRNDMLREEVGRLGRVNSELRDALAVVSAAKEEQTGRIAWLSGQLDTQAKQPDWDALQSELNERLADLSERVNKLPTLEEVARIHGVADLLTEQDPNAPASDVVHIARR
jgi:hypothetical protein